MTELTYHDLQFALIRTPKTLLQIMKRSDWAGRIFVGGGFLRSSVAGEYINDIDVFVTNEREAVALAELLVAEKEQVYDGVAQKPFLWRTDNAITVKCFKPYVQIIHRWTFPSAQAVSDSFDFTCCCAAFWFAPHDDGISLGAGEWRSVCDPRFYCDVAAKRLIYRNPARNEDAGGSMLRVLKYYQKGYRIPLDSLADVITRLVQGVKSNHALYEVDAPQFSRVICGLLREVDPAIDPSHVAHLPAERSREKNTELGDSLAEHL